MRISDWSSDVCSSDLIDEIVIEEELEEAEQSGEGMPFAPDYQRLAGRPRIGEQGRAGADEAVGDRPGRRHRPQLLLDDDPGTPPDEGDDDEGAADARLKAHAVVLGHRHLHAPVTASTYTAYRPPPLPT